MYKKRLCSGMIAGAALAALLLAPLARPAQAQVFLDMTVNPFAQTTNAGSSSFWDVVLTNNTGGAVTVSFTSFSPGFPVTPDVDVSVGSLPTSPLALADGASITLTGFMTTQVHANAVTGTYDALAEMDYDATDADGNDFLDMNAVSDWQLNTRATIIPEPASITLMLLAVPAIGLVRRRR